MTAKYLNVVVDLPQTVNDEYTQHPSSLEHGVWFGNLIGVPRSVQKKFVELMVDAHCDLSIGESIQHIYTTLGILQQALYTIIDENASPKLGAWKKQGLGIIPETPALGQ